MNTKTCLSEINNTISDLEKVLQSDCDFEELHEKVKSLCLYLCSKKSDFKTIDCEYPNPIVISLPDDDGEPDLDVPNRSDVLSGKRLLAEECIAILMKLQKQYSLKLKLENSKI